MTESPPAAAQPFVPSGGAALAAKARYAMLLGALGVLGFSGTLPATRFADQVYNGWTVAFGRAVCAALLAIVVLAVAKQPVLPPRRALRSLWMVIGGAVVGFPLLTSLALKTVDSAHGAVVTGLIPAATAGAAILLAGERPRRSYWVALAMGLAAVVSMPIAQGAGRLQPADLLLLAAVVVTGFGYAQGGVLARQYGGWRVICWALVVSLPITVPVTIASVAFSPPHAPTAAALLGMAYVSAVSMLTAFFAWYEGLARGGVARVGRLQLIQPVLTIIWSVLLLGEHIDWATAVAALVVLAAVAIGRNAKVDRSAATPPSPAPNEGPTSR